MWWPADVVIYRDPNNGKPKMNVMELERVLVAYEEANGLEDVSTDCTTASVGPKPAIPSSESRFCREGKTGLTGE